MSAPARRHEAGEIRSPDGSLPDRRHANDLLRLRPLSGFDHLDMALIPCHLFDSP
jgi:hypothetical protein